MLGVVRLRFKRPFAWWLLISLTVAGFVGLCKLSWWQWQRAQEKSLLLHQVALNQQQPLSINDIQWQQLTSLNGLALTGQVQWLSPYSWLLDNQIVDGRPGYDVVIPVRSGTDQLLLVNLGWVAAPMSRDELPTIQIPTQFALDGILRVEPTGVLLGQNIEVGEYPQRAQQLRVADFNAQSGLMLPNAVFYQRTSPWLFHYQPSVMPPEKHQAYALQWAGLACVWLVGGMLLSKRPV